MNKKTKRLFSLLLALVMILTSIPIVAMPTLAETTNAKSPERYGVYLSVKGFEPSNRRSKSNIINVCSDIQATNNQGKMSVGYWIYDISGVPQDSVIDSASLDITTISCPDNTNNNIALEFYNIPASYLTTDDILEDINAYHVSSGYQGLEYQTDSERTNGGDGDDQSNNTEHFNYVTGTNDVNDAYQGFKNYYGLNDTAPLLSIKNDASNSKTNIADAIAQAKARGENKFVLAAIYTEHAASNVWSDAEITHPTITVNYTPVTLKTASADVTRWGICRSSNDTANRYNGDRVNIISDDRNSTADNKASVAFWVYNMPSVPAGSKINSVTFNVKATEYNQDRFNNCVDFFWLPASYLTSENIITDATAANGKQSQSTVFMANGIDRVYETFNSHYNNPTLLLSKPNSNPMTDSDAAKIKTAMTNAIANGETQFIIAAVQKYPLASTSDTVWSDAWFEKPVINVKYAQSADYNSTTINKDNNENTVTGRVTVGNVIYTSADTNKYNYGTWIYDTDPYSTPITFAEGFNITSLKQVELVDAGGKVLTTRTDSNHLALAHQDMGLDKFKVQNDQNVTATLRFVFTDGKMEYHRVAVKSVPVEAHLVMTSQTWNAGQTETSYEIRFLGSYGSIDKSTGEPSGEESQYTGNWDELGNIQYAGTTTARGGDYYAHFHMRENLGNNSYRAYDKVAGYAAFRNQKDTPTTVVPTARYYIDKSNTALANGDLWSTTNGKYTLPIRNSRWVRLYKNCKAPEECYLSVQTTPSGGAFDRTYFTGLDAQNNNDCYTINYIDDASVNTSATETNVVYRIRSSVNYIEPKVKLSVNLFDKGTTRTAYNNAVANSEYNNDSKYTASAYADYLNRLLEAEAYLSNFENTTNEGLSTDYKSNIISAQNALKENTGLRGDVQKVIDACNEAYPKTNDTQYTQASRNSLLNTLDTLTYVSRNGSTFTSKVPDPREFSKEDEINEINKITSAVNNLVGPADWTALDAAYNRADQILTSLNGADAKYTSTSLQALINAVNQANLEGVMTASNRPNIFSDSQHTIDANATRIQEALDGLVEPTIDLSTYKAMNDWLDSYDKDVYGLTPEELNTAQSGLDTAALASDLSYNNTINGHTSTLNVFRDDIDSQGTAIDTAISTAMTTMNDNIVAYTVTATNATPASGTYAYGTRVTFTATDSNEDTAWYMSYNSTDSTRTKQYQANGSTYSLNVFGNITVEAHSRTTATPNKVTITKKYTGTSQNSGLELIDFVNGSYTLPQPSAVAGYAFQNYTVNGETKNAGDVLTITKDTAIAANYQYDGSTYTVTIGGTAANHNYNDKVELNAAEGKVWLQKISANGQPDEYRMFYNGPTTTLYVVGNINLISVESTELGNYNISEKPIYLLNEGTMVAEHKLVFNGQVVQPEEKTVKEYGVLIGRPKTGGQITASDVKVENAGDKTNYKILRAKSTKKYGTDQFTIRVGGLENSTGVIYKGYVILEDNATKQITTVYTDAVYYN